MHIVEQHRGVLVTNVLPLILVALAFDNWQEKKISWQVLVVIMGFAVLFLLLTIWIALSNTIFSEEGICRANLLKKKTIPWNQVIQACVISTDNGPETYCFVFTFVGGECWKTGETVRFWKSRNKSGRCTSARYSSELHNLVLNCYGPLDFDLSGGKEEI